MEKHIRDKLTGEQRSPQQTVGQAKLANIPVISHGRICQLIRKDGAEGGLLWKDTRYRLKHRKRPAGGKQAGIKNKVSIERRPSVADTGERSGDPETDTVTGKDGKGAVLTLTGRLTGFLRMEKLPPGKTGRTPC